MDNNFDENNVPGNYDTNNQGADFQGVNTDKIQPENSAASIPPQPQYIPPQNGYPYNPNYQNMGVYPPPMQNAPEKRRISNGCLWTLISTIAVMFAIIVVLVVLIVKAAGKNSDDNSPFLNLNTETAERIVIELPTVEKPVLEEKYYENEETGLLTPVGVAKVILPSQVQVLVYDEVPYAPVSSGSGIILTEDGYILTNAHVVDSAVRLSAVFYDGTESEAVIVGMDKKSDLAVIKVNKTGLTPAQIGTSSSLVIGEEVALAGAGGGFENTVTYGHITGLDREINTDYISSSTILCIQADAALNPGNSGGALVNMYGQVIGVAVALMNHETYENIGFSIAIDDAVPIAEDLIALGYVSSRTRVGITYASIGDAAASQYNIKSGLCVMEIDPSCDVAGSGIRPYDIITEMDGVRVFGAEEVSRVLADKVPDDTVTLTVFRKNVAEEGYEFTVDIKLEADTSSISGYSPTEEETDYLSRDIVN